MRGLTLLSLAALAYFGAETVGGNGFLAAFLAGLAFGNALGERATAGIRRFTKAEGELLIFATFLLFGALVVPVALEGLDWRHAAYALLSLTVVRMAPVALALAGTPASLPTRLFLGWFGPRGAASILYLFLVSEREGVMELHALAPAVTTAICLSVMLHGASAAPASAAYARALARRGAEI